MKSRPEITKKDINFVNDIDLRNILLERLEEIDEIFLVNANYSTVFLAMSTIEGILKHVATIFQTEILRSPDYPHYPSSIGKHKRFKDLTIDELYLLLKELDILPDIKRVEHVYGLLREYRNFIHPQAQIEKNWNIDLGQAQMALGLLNTTIDYLARYIFIKKEVFKKLAGKPSYDFSNKTLDLELHKPPLHSFLILNHPVSKNLSLNFDLELHQHSVFNFVFNFKNEGSFKMIRLDNRRSQRTRNCLLLYCTQKYHWTEILFAEQKYPPEESPLSIEIKIDFPNKIFSFAINGIIYKFKDKEDNFKNLFAEIKQDLKIGFFNEVEPVKITNINILW